MKNYQINQILKSWAEVRQQWIDALVANPNHTEACHHILSINAKMEVYHSMWSWAQEDVDNIEMYR